MKTLLVLLVMFGATAAFGEMYTWKDSHGTSFYTNSLYDIPAKYLKKARVLDVATGKKGGFATAQPAAPHSAGAPTPAPAAPGSAPYAVPTAAAPAAAPPVPGDPTPTATPGPYPVPSATGATPSNLPAREVRQGRAQRRRDRSRSEEE
jgi:hypothetical protein